MERIRFQLHKTDASGSRSSGWNDIGAGLCPPQAELLTVCRLPMLLVRLIQGQQLTVFFGANPAHPARTPRRRLSAPLPLRRRTARPLRKPRPGCRHKSSAAAMLIERRYEEVRNSAISNRRWYYLTAWERSCATVFPARYNSRNSWFRLTNSGLFSAAARAMAFSAVCFALANRPVSA